jgi:hypothetical protein
MKYKYKTFKAWLYKTWPEQRDSLVISENDERMLRLAFNAGRISEKQKTIKNK